MEFIKCGNDYFLLTKEPSRKGLGYIEPVDGGYRVVARVYEKNGIYSKEIAQCESIGLAQLLLQKHWGIAFA